MLVYSSLSAGAVRRFDASRNAASRDLDTGAITLLQAPGEAPIEVARGIRRETYDSNRIRGRPDLATPARAGNAVKDSGATESAAGR